MNGRESALPGRGSKRALETGGSVVSGGLAGGALAAFAEKAFANDPVTRSMLVLLAPGISAVWVAVWPLVLRWVHRRVDYWSWRVERDDAVRILEQLISGATMIIDNTRSDKARDELRGRIEGLELARVRVRTALPGAYPWHELQLSRLEDGDSS